MQAITVLLPTDVAAQLVSVSKATGQSVEVLLAIALRPLLGVFAGEECIDPDLARRLSAEALAELSFKLCALRRWRRAGIEARQKGEPVSPAMDKALRQLRKEFPMARLSRQRLYVWRRMLIEEGVESLARMRVGGHFRRGRCQRCGNVSDHRYCSDACRQTARIAPEVI